jgi:hypothetical protein
MEPDIRLLKYSKGLNGIDKKSFAPFVESTESECNALETTMNDYISNINNSGWDDDISDLIEEKFKEVKELISKNREFGENIRKVGEIIEGLNPDLDLYAALVSKPDNLKNRDQIEALTISCYERINQIKELVGDRPYPVPVFEHNTKIIIDEEGNEEEVPVEEEEEEKIIIDSLEEES